MKEEIMKQFFAPIKARYRLLLLFPVLNLLFLSIVLLFLKAPKEAILLSMGSISFVVFLIASKKFASLFYYSSLAFNLMIFFVTWGNESLWTKAWSLSMMVTLTIGYYLSSEVLEFYTKDEKVSSEDKTEKGLWKNRFETLRDAHNLEALTVEEDLNKGKEAIKEKDSQIHALEKLIEVTHKEAAALSKQKHALMDKVKCEGDSRGDEEIKKQNLILRKELDGRKNLERDINALQDEKSLFIDKISILQENNRLLEQADQTAVVEALQKDVQDLQAALEKADQSKVIEDLNAEIEALKGTKSGGYSRNQVFKLIEDLNFFRTEKFQLEQVIAELKEKLNEPQKPFKWQVWKGDKKEKKADSKKTISMTDLGKGLKI